MWDGLRDGLANLLRWLDRPLRLAYPATLIFLLILTVFAVLERSGRLAALQGFLDAFFLIRPALILLIYLSVILGLWAISATFNFEQEVPWLREMTDPRGWVGWFDTLLILTMAGAGIYCSQYLGFVTTDMFFVIALTLATAVIGLTRLRRFVIVGVDRHPIEDDLWAARSLQDIVANLKAPPDSLWREYSDDQVVDFIVQANPYLNDIATQAENGIHRPVLACDELIMPAPEAVGPRAAGGGPPRAVGNPPN